MSGKKINKKREPDDKTTREAANLRRLFPSVTQYESATLPRKADRTTDFKKDWNRLQQGGRYDLSLLKSVMMHLIANEGPLPGEYMDHPLSGAYKDHRDCHIGGDWLLIYKLDKDSVIFVRTGTHSELFKN